MGLTQAGNAGELLKVLALELDPWNQIKELTHLPGVSPQAVSLTSLRIYFLVWKVSIKMVPTSLGYCEHLIFENVCEVNSPETVIRAPYIQLLLLLTII